MSKAIERKSKSVITQEDIKLSYAGSPEDRLKLRLCLMLASEFVMSKDQEENLFQSQRHMALILNMVYGEIKESLCDILEEYQMCHSNHKAGRSKAEEMIHELIRKIPT